MTGFETKKIKIDRKDRFYGTKNIKDSMQTENVWSWTHAVDMEQIRVRFELYLGWNRKDISASEIVKEISAMPDIFHIEIDTP